METLLETRQKSISYFWNNTKKPSSKTQCTNSDKLTLILLDFDPTLF